MLELPDAKTRFFISYNSRYGDLAETLEKQLSERGHQIWRDKSTLHSGDDWRTEIARAIEWSQTIILLLTPGAQRQIEIYREIETARRLSRRVEAYCFFPPSEWIGEARQDPDGVAAALHRLIGDLHIDELDPGLLDRPEALVGRILQAEEASHPMPRGHFERVFSRRLLQANEITTLESSIIALYRGYFSNLAAVSPALLINQCLLLMIERAWREAREVAERAPIEEHPLVEFYRSLILLEGRRVAHLSPSVASRAIGHAERAHRLAQAPLTGLHLALLMWDGGQRRGPRVAQYVIEAMQALARSPNDREEAGRYLRFCPLRKMQLPFDPMQFQEMLDQLRGGASD